MWEGLSNRERGEARRLGDAHHEPSREGSWAPATEQTVRFPAPTSNKRRDDMSLRLIPTRVHGVIDYLTSGTLLAAPELLRLKDVPSAALTLRLSGAKAAAYSLLTDYELGLVRVL